MRGVVVFILDGISEFGAKLGILNGNRGVDDGMAGDIRGVVSERAEGERVFIRILALREKLADEVAAANVVNQIAEFDAAEGIVPEILNDGATVGVAVRFFELIFR